jgi:prevent-host-death family protein
MGQVTIRELRNQGGRVVDRARAGEQITITRGGKAVAELRPLGSEPLTAAVLLQRRRRLPPIDPAELRADLDAILEPLA